MGIGVEAWLRLHAWCCGGKPDAGKTPVGVEHPDAVKRLRGAGGVDGWVEHDSSLSGAGIRTSSDWFAVGAESSGWRGERGYASLAVSH